MNLFNKHAPAILFVSALLAQNVLSAGAQPAGTPTGKLVQAIKNGSLRRSIVGAVAALAATPFREHAPDEASTTYEPSTNQNNGVDSEEADEGEHYSNQSGPNNLSVPITEQQQGLNQKLIAAIKRGDWGAVKYWIEEVSDVNAVNGGHSAVPTCLSRTARSRPSAFDDAEDQELRGQRVCLEHVARPSDVVDVQRIPTPPHQGGSVRPRPSGSNDVEEEDQERRGQNRRVNTTNVVSSMATILTGCPKGFTELHYAAQHGHLEELKILLLSGADINAVDHQGFTALHIAAFYGQLGVLKYLLFKYADIADINVVDNQGLTALHVAAYSGQLEVVKCLLFKGADIKAVDNQGFTALHIAAFYGRLDVLEYLLFKKADIEAVDHKGFTALHIAAYKGQTEVLKCLLFKGADIEAVGKLGATVLHLVVKSGQFEVLEYLQSLKGTNIDDVDHQGATALLFAAYFGHLKILRYLIFKKADVKAVTHINANALHLAAEGGQLEMVKYLLFLGVDKNAPTRFGATALYLAAYYGQLEVVKLLQPHGSILGAYTLLAAYEGASGIDFISCMINEDIEAVLSKVDSKPFIHETNRAADLIQKILLEYFIEAMD